MADENLKLTLLSPERRLVESVEVQEVNLTGSKGHLCILPGHAAIVGTLEGGPFSYRDGSGRVESGVITTGFFEVSGNQITVLAENLELQGEIDVQRAKRAQKLSEDTLRDANLGEHEFKKYQLKLQRSLIRQHAASAEGNGE